MMDVDFVKALRLALAVLSERTMSMIALLMTFGLACWAMYMPSWERDAMAAFFACAIYWPLVTRERKHERESVHTED